VRTIVYVDAFNLYYGCLKGTHHKWLDVVALSRLLLPGHSIHRVKYFTARVSPRPTDPGQPQRQQAYLRALESRPEIEIHYGHYLSHVVRMPLADPGDTGPRTARVLKTEEKGSDVNLASHLIHDAHRRVFEAAALVSSEMGIPFTHVATSDSVGGWEARDIPSLGDIRSLGLITLGRFRSSTRGLAAKRRAVRISGGFAGRMALSAPTARQRANRGPCRAACCAVEPAIGRYR